MTVCCNGSEQRGLLWQRLFAEQAPDIGFRLWPDIGDPADIRYLVGWTLPSALVALIPTCRWCFRSAPVSTSSISTTFPKR